MKMAVRLFWVALIVSAMLTLAGCGGGETPDENLKAEMARRDKAHTAEIESMKASHKRIVEDYDRRLKQKDVEISELTSRVSGLKSERDDTERKYKTSTVVCIALGAAVIGALFVGTLMGAKGRRDAMRVCKNRNTPTEVVG